MKSLYAWIVIAMVGTSSLALLAFTMISDRNQRTYVDPVLQAMDGLELESARDALHSGGPAAAAHYLARLDRLFGTRHYLLNRNGDDVISGEIRSGWLPHPPAMESRGFLGSRFVVTHRSQDGRYWLLSVGPQLAHGGQFIPYSSAFARQSGGRSSGSSRAQRAGREPQKVASGDGGCGHIGRMITLS